MVGEEENLGALREVGEGAEGGGGAGVVELDQKVVDDQGEGIVAVEGGFEGGEAEREIELVGGAEAHAGDAHRLAAAGANALEDGLVAVVVVDGEALEGAESQGRKER